LEYKAKKFDCEIIVATRWFPSSKTCSNCGHIQDMPLKERTYNCGSCGHSMDRDLNFAVDSAQKNLLNSFEFPEDFYLSFLSHGSPIQGYAIPKDLVSFRWQLKGLLESEGDRSYQFTHRA
jgi:hypothetical protein